MAVKRYDEDDEYLHVYHYLMSGPFDGSLKWPFKGDIVVRLVNQKEGKIEYFDHRYVFKYSKIEDDRCRRVTDSGRALETCSKPLPLVDIDEYLDDEDSMTFIVTQL